ncbi:hypothetical protein [Actinomyces ruminis]|uniref:hypothetical protein n=1 Tax=Actinomyces ruminis TaxID=1937003 RepID=UPI0015D48ABD
MTTPAMPKSLVMATSTAAVNPVRVMTAVAPWSCRVRTSAGQPWAVRGTSRTTTIKRAQAGRAAEMARSTGTTLATASRVQAGSTSPTSMGRLPPRRVP